MSLSIAEGMSLLGYEWALDEMQRRRDAGDPLTREELMLILMQEQRRMAEEQRDRGEL